MNATEFKARCLEVLDHLEPRGLVITKRGRAVARLIPERALENEQFVGSMKGQIKVHGDLFSTGERWDAQP